MGKEKFAERYNMFLGCERAELFRRSRKSAEDMASAHRRRRRGACTDLDPKRVENAMMLVQLGEISSARQALEGAELAPAVTPLRER